MVFVSKNFAFYTNVSFGSFIQLDMNHLILRAFGPKVKSTLTLFQLSYPVVLTFHIVFASKP